MASKSSGRMQRCTICCFDRRTPDSFEWIGMAPFSDEQNSTVGVVSEA